MRTDGVRRSVGRRSRVPASAWKMAVFTSLTLVLLGVLATLIGNVSFSPTTRYYADFTDASGVLRGDRVRVSGVEVGTVRGVELVPGEGGRERARVEFTVRNDVPLMRSARLELRWENLVGQRYLAIEERPYDGARMAPDRVFPVGQTTPAVNLTQLFNGFQPLLRALDPKDMNRLSFELVRAFQGEATNIAQLMDDTASLTTTISDKDQVIGEVVRNLEAVLETVGRRDAELTGLIVRFRDLMVGLASDRETIAVSLPALAELMEQSTRLVGDVRHPLGRDIKGLGEVAGALHVHRRELEHSLRELPPKLRMMVRTGSYGSYFNFYVCGQEVRIRVLGGTVYLGTPGIAANDRKSACAKADVP